MTDPVESGDARDRTGEFASDRAPAAGGARAADDCANLLVCEDNDLLRDYLQDLLADRGYRVQVAGSGAAAISAAQAGHVDLLLTDIGLLDMPGLEVAAQVRRLHPDCAVLFTSGASVELPADFAASRFLLKPFRTAELHDAIAALLSA